MSTFDKAFEIVVGHEGGYTDNPQDPGNWTGGACFVGACKGTNYGISAAAYPALNIRAMTQADAKLIYRHDYWNRVAGDDLPPALALLVFDAAVNNGVDRAAKWLQAAVGAKQDGAIGPATLRAVDAKPAHDVCAEFMALRITFMTGLTDWRTFGRGWARRLAKLPFDAQTMESA